MDIYHSFSFVHYQLDSYYWNVHIRNNINNYNRCTEVFAALLKGLVMKKKLVHVPFRFYSILFSSILSHHFYLYLVMLADYTIYYYYYYSSSPIIT